MASTPVYDGACIPKSVRLSYLLLFGSIALSECKAQNLKPISFNNIPQWIEEHIEFPAAASYGTEQFCLSATWDGRVFLTSRPYTIDPACEHAIVEAVKSAQRCYFVVETDGKTGGIIVEASVKEIGGQIAEFVAGTNWKPATQQGVPVRSIRTFAIAGASEKAYTYNRNIPEDFGRHYVYLTTPPYARNRAYMQSDGSYSKYPFNAQGQFDHKEYQNQQIRAAKNSATGSHNFTNDYNSQLKKRYTK